MDQSPRTLLKGREAGGREVYLGKGAERGLTRKEEGGPSLPPDLEALSRQGASLSSHAASLGKRASPHAAQKPGRGQTPQTRASRQVQEFQARRSSRHRGRACRSQNAVPGKQAAHTGLQSSGRDGDSGWNPWRDVRWF